MRLPWEGSRAGRAPHLPPSATTGAGLGRVPGVECFQSLADALSELDVVVAGEAVGEEYGRDVLVDQVVRRGAGGPVVVVPGGGQPVVFAGEVSVGGAEAMLHRVEVRTGLT